ncbi:MAG: hypothetical protein NZ529_05220 [Cytophagaceae bacterium]|nr:hypothetical protein [Cytophagaceae bacterium]MDW8456177.1 hypothetical protein [Cytophagaceae bacterium]
MKTSTIIIFVLLAAFSRSLHAQVYTGGNASVGYDNGWYADIAPIIGYQIERYRVGVSPIFSYRTYVNSSQVWSYGGRIFNQVDIVQGAFAHAEFQILNTEYVYVYPDGNVKTRVWVKSLPVGAGYQYPISDRASFQAIVLYDLLQDKRSVYNKPTFRAGVIYRF